LRIVYSTRPQKSAGKPPEDGLGVLFASKAAFLYFIQVLFYISFMSEEIGAVFTPAKWASFAVERFGLFDKWLGGCTICDPTMGSGNLLLALIDHGVKQGVRPGDLPLERLFGMELKKRHRRSFFRRARELYCLSLPEENFLYADILFLKDEERFDILFGNPPWKNFTDLPASYKEKTKKLFFDYDLIHDPRSLLLGGSRVDIAALVLKKTIQRNLKPGGEAVFFVPLSLLSGGGAHAAFRNYSVNKIPYCIDTVFDFHDLAIFEGVSTRYGLISLRRDALQKFPLAYHRWNSGVWENLFARPLFSPDDPLSVFSPQSEDYGRIRIEVGRGSLPRQGINTCGANDVFFFDEYETLEGGLCRVANKTSEALLPRQYVFPLVTAPNFGEDQPAPRKWVLLPYSGTGKPLGEKELAKIPHLKEYLHTKKQRLTARRGILIGAWIRRGLWWALFGVGEYSFSPHKIIWEAYGKNTFRPKLFSGSWQANQALQAFMPFDSEEEARGALRQLEGGAVEKYLLSLKTEGTMNWAQPGKIKRLLTVKEADAQNRPAEPPPG
jgi:hypothetical protein